MAAALKPSTIRLLMLVMCSSWASYVVSGVGRTVIHPSLAGTVIASSLGRTFKLVPARLLSIGLILRDNVMDGL